MEDRSQSGRIYRRPAGGVQDRVMAGHRLPIVSRLQYLPLVWIPVVVAILHVVNCGAKRLEKEITN